MSHGPSRRAFLGAAAAAGGAVALPVICSGSAHAADARDLRELPIVNRPDHPGAVYARGAHPEPLNATVDCALHGRVS